MRKKLTSAERTKREQKRARRAAHATSSPAVRAAELRRAKTPEGMAFERERYAETWNDEDASRFSREGHYKWMAEQVQGHHLVLEIGTGNGGGTIELLRAGHVVVSVDENPACLRLAEQHIQAAGYPVTMVLRGTVSAGRDGYVIDYTPISQRLPSEGALLIEGDTINDLQLGTWLLQENFDAVVCWLIGSHRARQLNSALPTENALLYRLRVQNALYVQAETLLRPGGVLNLIDRGLIATTEDWIERLRQDSVDAHRDQASPTQLVVEAAVNTRPYTPPGGVKMEATLGTSGTVVPFAIPGFQSVRARKP